MDHLLLTSFSDYLGKQRSLEEAVRKRLLELVEKDLGGFLRRWVDSGFTEVFDSAYDHNYYEKARQRIARDSQCQQENPDYAQFSKALQLVASFLKKEQRKKDLGSTRKPHHLSSEQPPSSSASSAANVPATQPSSSSAGSPSSPPVLDLTEGELREMHAVKHERNPEARRQCIEHYCSLHGGRIYCECCGFDFKKNYGSLGVGYIEIHHLNPISQQDEVHPIDPRTDLVPLCANCHAMIHRVLASDKNLEGMESLNALKRIVEECNAQGECQ